MRKFNNFRCLAIYRFTFWLTVKYIKYIKYLGDSDVECHLKKPLFRFYSYKLILWWLPLFPLLFLNFLQNCHTFLSFVFTADFSVLSYMKFSARCLTYIPWWIRSGFPNMERNTTVFVDESDRAVFQVLNDIYSWPCLWIVIANLVKREVLSAQVTTNPTKGSLQ